MANAGRTRQIRSRNSRRRRHAVSAITSPREYASDPHQLIWTENERMVATTPAHLLDFESGALGFPSLAPAARAGCRITVEYRSGGTLGAASRPLWNFRLLPTSAETAFSALEAERPLQAGLAGLAGVRPRSVVSTLSL